MNPHRASPGTALAGPAAVALVLALAWMAPSGSAATATEGLAFEKGADFDTAHDAGWVENFTLGAGNASFNLTLRGPSGGTVTIDDLVAANRTSEEGFRVNVTDPLEGDASVKIRFWNGTTPPRTDAAANVCVVVNTSEAGVANGTCRAPVVHLQYVLTLPEGVDGSGPFSFRLVGVTSEDAGGGGGRPAPPSPVFVDARSVTAPDGVDHRYVTGARRLGAGSQLEVSFPGDEERIGKMRLTVDEGCSSLRATVDRYPGVPPGRAPPADETLGAVDVDVTCWGEPFDGSVNRTAWVLSFGREELDPDVARGQVHALYTGQPWQLAGSLAATADGERLPLEAEQTEPSPLVVVVDDRPPELDVSVVEDGDGPGALKILVSAVDKVAVERLVVFADGERVQTVQASAFRANVRAVDVGAGPVTVRAVAEDVSGLASQAWTNATLVPDTAPPVLEVRVDGPSRSGTLVVRANVSDNVGVERVVFRVGGEQIASLQAPPFRASVDVSSLASGFHRVEVEAVDGTGNLGVFDTVFYTAAGDRQWVDEDREEENGIGLGWGLAIAALGLAGVARARWRP